MCRLNACRHLKHLEANAQVRLAHKTMPPRHWAVDLGIPWHIQPWSPQYDRGGYHLRLSFAFFGIVHLATCLANRPLHLDDL